MSFDPQLSVFVLGGFRLERAGHSMSEAMLQRRGAGAVLKLLAITPAHRLERDQLIEVLWPEQSPDSGRNKFAKALHLVRHSLQPDLGSRQPSNFLHLLGSTVSLDAENVWIDIDEFEDLVTKASAAFNVSAYEEALTAYGGELLPEHRYDDWTVARREELEGRRMQLLLGLAEAYERGQAYGPAVQRLQEALRCDPIREDVHERLMRIYGATGNVSMGLRQYQLCRDALQTNLSVAPSATLHALYEELSQRQREAVEITSPRLSSPASLPVALPRDIARLMKIRLVGRDGPMARLRDELHNAAEGRGTLLLIRGQAGMGKSRLLAELADESREHSTLTLWGASYEQSVARPYGPFVEAFERHLIGCSKLEQRRILETYQAVAQLISVGAGSMGEPAGGPGERKEVHMFADVARLLGDLATKQPLLLLLDDLHAADKSSLQLLHHLARVAPDRCWTIVGAYRAEEITRESDLGVLISTLRRRGLVDELSLERLDDDACDQMTLMVTAQADRGHRLPSSPPRQTVNTSALAHIRKLAQGNPLFVTELTRAFQEHGLSGIAAVAPREYGPPVPEIIADLIEARLRPLGEASNHMLAVASLIGPEGSYRVLRDSAGLPEEQLLDALDRAIASGVLDEAKGAYTFRHPLYRLAVVEKLTITRRAHLHGVIATVLEAHDPTDVTALAYHYARSNEDLKANQYLELAGDRARSLYANRDALDLYRDLVERLDRQQRFLDSARVRQKLAHVLTTLARYEQADAELASAARVYHEYADLATEARVVAQMARIAFSRGTPGSGLKILETWSDRTDLPDTARGELFMVLSSLEWLAGRYEEQLAAATEASSRLPLVSDDLSIAHVAVEAEVWRGIGLIAVDRIDDGVAILEAVLPRAQALDALEPLIRAHNTLAAVHQERGRQSRQEPHLNAALRAAERLGDPTRIAFMRYRRGWYRWTLGDWAQARQDLRSSVELSEQTGVSWVTPYALYGIACLSYAEGDRDQARALAQQCLQAAERGGDTRAVWAAHSLLAKCEVADGRATDAASRLKPLIGGAGMAEGDRALLLGILAWAHVRNGDLGAAEGLAEQAIWHAQNGGAKPELVQALRVRAHIYALGDNLDAAERLLGDALELAQDTGDPYEEARVLEMHGLVLSQPANSARRKKLLSDAHEIFQRLGARRDASRTAAALLK